MYCQSTRYSQAELKNEDTWKQDAVKFKLTICTVFGIVFENIFMPMNPLSKVF